jgi:secondary thiamine-phosphate synthase enzyme
LAPQELTRAMRQAITTIEQQTRARGLVEVTRPVRAWAETHGMSTGLLTVFIRHTSASLLIQENADPDVLADLCDFLDRLVPDDASRYRHRAEGADDMPSHIRSALTQTQLSIPLADGRLALGTWQGIYVFEQRRAPHRRQLVLHLIGE